MNKIFSFLRLAAFCPLFAFACGQQGLHWPPVHPMLEPGDQIDSMVITTGAEDAPPLWAFCSKSLEGKGRYILDCRAPALGPLGIGNIFLYADDATTSLDWSEFIWELSIDGQKVDLDSFGTFDYVVPSMSKKPSPVREIFKRATAWDIVLTDLKPGHHTLRFVAQSKIESYTWYVNLEIEPVDKTNISSVPFPLHS